jgi:hypothetical protein
MEGRPIVRRLRGLQRGPFVLYSWPFSSGLELYALCQGFQSGEDGHCCVEECEFHGQVKPLGDEADRELLRNPVGFRNVKGV